MRRTSSAIVLMASLLVAACSGGGGGTAAPGATTASEAPGASSPAASGESPGASTSAGTGFDANSVSGDLILQGWSAGAVEAPILQQVLDDFQAKYPNIKVKFEPISGNYVDAMAPKFSSGDVPDVFYVDSSQAATWIDDGVLEPLDDYIAKSGFDTSTFYPGYLDAFKGPDGKLYGLPKDGNTLAMAFNTDLLQKAGVTTPPTDWASLTDAVGKLKASGVKTPLCLSESLDRALAFIYAGGGSLYNADMTGAAIDSPESVAAIDQYLGFFKDGDAKGPKALGDDWCGKALGEQHAAIIFEGGWLDPFMKENYSDVKYQWAEMPAGPGGKATLGFTVSYSMGVDSKNKDASWVLISYLTGPEGMDTWTKGGVANPSRNDLPGGEGKEILIQGADYAKPWAFTPGFSKVNDAFNNAFTAAVQGDGSGQDIAAATKAAIDASQG
jgi:multiple sugar transport system substrate-binding protein